MRVGFQNQKHNPASRHCQPRSPLLLRSFSQHCQPRSPLLPGTPCCEWVLRHLGSWHTVTFERKTDVNSVAGHSRCKIAKKIGSPKSTLRSPTLLAFSHQCQPSRRLSRIPQNEFSAMFMAKDSGNYHAYPCVIIGNDSVELLFPPTVPFMALTCFSPKSQMLIYAGFASCRASASSTSHAARCRGSSVETMFDERKNEEEIRQGLDCFIFH